MPNLTRTLPDPTWHGTPGDIKQRWLDFVLAEGVRRSQTEPNRLKERIVTLEQEVRNCKRYSAEYKDERETHTTQIKKIEERLAIGQPDFDALAAEILAMPIVVATRVDECGALAILIRPVREDGGDVGDVEISTQSMRYRGWRDSFYVNRSRCPRTMWENVRFEHLEPSSILARPDSHTAILSGALCDAIRILAADSQYVELITTLANLCTQVRSHADRLPKADPNAVPIYTGHVSDPGEALKQLHTMVVLHDEQKRLDELKLKVQRCDRELESWRNQLRTLQRDLRTCKAELAELEQLAKASPELTKAEQNEALKQLAFITTGVPGVMGMRFSDDGTPVVHVRTSNVQEGKRYDLGDVELHFKPYNNYAQYNDLGVLQYHVTRHPNPDYPAPYTHMYGGRGFDPSNWFCFGSRSSQINSLMNTGVFDHAFNIMVNCLNSLNRSHRDYARYATQIPLDEVWHHAPRRRARRRTAA